MSIDQLSSELNKVDTNQQNGLEQVEIDEFLMNEENVRALGDIMQNICDTQPETLAQFKESTSKICERILKNDNISVNQGKILLFYLKYFHNENDKLGNKIIKSATKNVRYQATLNTISMENLTKDFNEKMKQERERRMNEWFDNLPGVKAAREDMERQSRDLRKCLGLLDSEDRLNNEDIAWLKEYKDSSETMLAPEDRDRLERRLKLEETDNSISEEVDSRIANSPLSNLDKIDTNIRNLKPNWSKIIQDIKNPEDVSKITEENISEYLPVKIEGQLQDNLGYIVSNFKNIIAKHLCLHPHYKQGWGVNPDAFITGIDLKNIVIENNLYESAISKIQKWKNQKVSKITEILNGNNHILFDVYLRQKIGEGKDEESRGRIFLSLMKEAKEKNLAKLEYFSRSNSYIKDVLNKYDEAIKEQNEAKRIGDIINQAKEFTVPSNLGLGNRNITKMRMFSMDQIINFATEYNKQKAKKDTSEYSKTFCQFYEMSKSFYESDFVKNLGLPNRLEPKEYFNYAAKLQSMQRDIDKINQEYKRDMEAAARANSVNTGPGSGGAIVGYTRAAKSKQSSHTNETMVKTAKDFVNLWKKSKGDYRPKSFYGIPLRWEKGPDPDDIIRDSFGEKLGDKWDSFVANIKGLNIQQAVGDLGGLVVGAVFATGTTIFTGSAILGGAAFEVGSKLGNGLTQGIYDLVVDGALGKGLGLFEEDGNNRYDGFVDSFLLGIGKNTRDEKGNVISAMSWGEWAIDEALNIGTSALTGAIGGNVLASPFKYAAIDTFFSKPLGNIVGAGVKAGLDMGKYEGSDIGVLGAVGQQMSEEFDPAELAMKGLKTLAMGGMLKGMGKLLTGPCSKYIKGFDTKLHQSLQKKGQRIADFLEKHGIKGGGNNLSEKLNESWGSLVQDGFGDMIADYHETASNLWKNISSISTLSVFTYGLVSEFASPREILEQRTKRLNELIGKEQNSVKREQYLELLARYERIDKELQSYEGGGDVSGTDNQGDKSRTHLDEKDGGIDDVREYKDEITSPYDIPLNGQV